MVFDEGTGSADIATNENILSYYSVMLVVHASTLNKTYLFIYLFIITGRIFESEIILIPPSLKISESSSNGSYRNTDEV